MNLYNDVIAYIYNNILTSNKLLCGREESLGTAHICLTSFHNSTIISIIVWVGRTVAFILLTHNSLMSDHDIMCMGKIS